MALTIETKLSLMTANRNALKEEIAGLHLYIDKLKAVEGDCPQCGRPLSCVACNNKFVIGMHRLTKPGKE